MFKRIAAIVFIYFCTVGAWMILGTTVLVRTQVQDRKLRGAVGSLWGAEHHQRAPSVYYLTTRERKVERFSQGEKITETKKETTLHPLTLSASEIDVDIRLAHRRKGLLWYATYSVAFKGSYSVANPTDERREVRFDFALPVRDAMYDDFHLSIGGKEARRIEGTAGLVACKVELGPGQEESVKVAYRSQGLDEWGYTFGDQARQVKNFTLTMKTDFDRIDFPAGGTSPTTKERTPAGWKLAWKYANLLSGTPIGMTMPQKLNPGPWVARVCYTAPVSLFLFFFLLFVLTTLRKVNLHPMNYFFVSAAFFSFHLLLAYLVDHLDIHVSFLMSSAVSIFLVVSYMRLVVGRRFAFLEVGVSQFVYLVLFSYTFFFEGYSGLAATVLCVVTLFVVMQLTGRVKWDELFQASAGKKSG
ncbi:MAG: inner membrane CreD family protein, partial [Planctomycetota bacterium]